MLSEKSEFGREKGLILIIKRILFPNRCPLCDKTISGERAGFCKKCEASLILIRGRLCPCCGRPILRLQQVCGDCEKEKHSFIGGRIVFSYAQMSGSIYRFKYMNRPAYAKAYAVYMDMLLGEWLKDLKPDCFIPVPLYKKRLIRRGYNQSEELAAALSKLSGIPVFADCVERIKNTLPQKQMDKKGRERNLKRAFIVRENVVKLSTVVLIDDIYTTGSTIESLTTELLEAGVRKVYFITLSAAGT